MVGKLFKPEKQLKNLHSIAQNLKLINAIN